MKVGSRNFLFLFGDKKFTEHYKSQYVENRRISSQGAEHIKTCDSLKTLHSAINDVSQRIGPGKEGRLGNIGIFAYAPKNIKTESILKTLFHYFDYTWNKIKGSVNNIYLGTVSLYGRDQNQPNKDLEPATTSSITELKPLTKDDTRNFATIAKHWNTLGREVFTEDTVKALKNKIFISEADDRGFIYLKDDFPFYDRILGGNQPKGYVPLKEAVEATPVIQYKLEQM